MSVVDKFIDYVHDEVVEHPEKSWEKMVFGFQANKLKTRILPKKNLSKGYQKLETMMMALVADALKDQGSYVWGNIFAPCEIMEALGLRTLSSTGRRTAALHRPFAPTTSRLSAAWRAAR